MNTIILTELFEHLPCARFSTEALDLTNYGRDWTRVFEPNPSLIFFPESTEEVSIFLKFCSERGICVVPSGGRTGLAGGAVAAHREVVLSLERMRKMGKIDLLARTLWCEGGCITEVIHQHAEGLGLIWPIDFASKGSSTVGGNIATNAGGVKVIRYGLTRNWVLGLTVVLMSGEVLRLNGSLEKNNTGLDLKHLFIGTEGIYGVITEAILKLAPMPKECDVIFFGLENLSKVFELFQLTRNSGWVINAFECLSRECLEIVLRHRALLNPFSEFHSQYVLLEIERPQNPEFKALFENWLASLFEDGRVEDAVLAQSPKEAKNIWAMREGISEALAHQAVLHKHDISLPIHRLQVFIEEWTQDLLQNYAGLKPFIFGHIGDGNLHVNLMKPPEMELKEFRHLCGIADERMFSWIQAYEGSVSAEHGIGLLKKHLLQFTRSESEIEFMRDFKRVFDPKNLLNPGKVL